MEKIQNANAVSIEADETTEVSCVSQLVVLLPCVGCDLSAERIHSFVQVQNRTAEVLTQELASYKS